MASQINGIGAIGTSASSDAVQGSNKLGKDEFLKLLVAQLANQDPTSPTDNQAFIAQLAQFSTVEQQSTMNDHLEALLVGESAAAGRPASRRPSYQQPGDHGLRDEEVAR